MLSKSLPRTAGRTYHPVPIILKGMAETWLAEFAPRRSPEWSRQALRWFEADVYPVIGDRPVAEIEKEDVLMVCRRAQDRGAQYTAECIRRYIAAVFEYANRRSITDVIRRAPCAERSLSLRPAISRRSRPKTSVNS